MRKVCRAGFSIGFAAALLFLFLALPCLLHADRLRALFGGARTDAVSGASIVIPGKPSGDIVVLLNADRHPVTLAAWTDFFTEQPTDVIFEDLHTLVMNGDAAGMQAAERYQARLAEHQMTIRRDNALLTASRTDAGAFDVVIASREAAEAAHLETAWNRRDGSVYRIDVREEAP